ncbi:MAG: hypothetical protein WCS52_00835 [bacterium]
MPASTFQSPKELPDGGVEISGGARLVATLLRISSVVVTDGLKSTILIGANPPGRVLEANPKEGSSDCGKWT